jgi:hypothetical protein
VIALDDLDPESGGFTGDGDLCLADSAGGGVGDSRSPQGQEVHDLGCLVYI